MNDSAENTLQTAASVAEGACDVPVAAVDARTATEEAFEEAFWRLYKTKPLRKISVAEVAQLAGYNRGTFYLHYEGIEDVLAAIEERLMERIRACVADCMTRLQAGEDPETVMGAVLRLYEENADYIKVLLGSKGDPAFAEALKAELKPLWAKYVLKRDVPEDGETDLTLEFTLSGALFMVRRWLDNPKGVSPEQMLHIVYHKVLGR